MIGRLLCALGLHAWSERRRRLGIGPLVWFVARCARPGCRAEKDCW